MLNFQNNKKEDEETDDRKRKIRKQSQDEKSVDVKDETLETVVKSEQEDISSAQEGKRKMVRFFPFVSFFYVPFLDFS